MVRILVVGATGQQGGGVVNALLAARRAEYAIRAISRNPSSPSALALQTRGVEVMAGNLDDPQSLLRACEGVDRAYLVTDFRGPKDIEGELEQGRIFVDAAKEAGVKHIVFSSVAGADIAQKVDHFYSKCKIEKYIASSGLDWTVIRPVGFMEVIPPPGIGRYFFLSAMWSLMGNTKQKYIACDDIGKAVALALINPDQFKSRIKTVAGEVATVSELEDGLARGEGVGRWPKIWLPRFLLIRLTPHHYRQIFEWLYKDNCQPGDPEETKKLIPDLMTIEEWAHTLKAKREKTE
ncbi:NmrA-like family domain-containing protein [Paramyrothecium foliicola]|nr:NmrA-like family domain-containing protein [Paramyrothecium foliicola]